VQYNHKNESILSKQEKWILLHGLHEAYKKFGIRSLRNNQNTFVGYFNVLMAINKRLWFCDAMGSDSQPNYKASLPIRLPFQNTPFHVIIFTVTFPTVIGDYLL
jgi:hypothetical protein